MTAIGWALVHFVWQGALIAVLLSFVLRGMRESSPQMRYVASCLSLLAMTLCVPATALFLNGTDGAAAPSTIAFTGTREVIANAYISQSAMHALRAWLETHMHWVVLLWAMGASLLLLRSAGGWYVARKQSRLGLSLEYPLSKLMERLEMTGVVEIYKSATATTPQVFGWLKPVIVVPVAVLAQLPPEQLEAVLAHELAHIRRRDYLVNLLQTIVENVLFYHPAVWWTSSRIRMEREQCCDDLAVQVCGDKYQYSKALLSLEEAKPAMALTASGPGLKERIARLLGAQAEPSRSWNSPSAPATAVVVATVLMGGAWWLQAEPPAPPAPPVPAVAPAPAATPSPSAHPAPVIAASSADSAEQPPPPAPAAPARRPAQPGAPPPPPPPPPAEGVEGGVVGGVARGVVEGVVGGITEAIDAEALQRMKEEVQRALEEAQESLKIDHAGIADEVRRALDEVKREHGERITDETRKSVERALREVERQQVDIQREVEKARRSVERAAQHSQLAQKRTQEQAQEYERRVRFANRKWTENGIEGSKTDRGKLYVQNGPPDEVESQTGGREVWKYKNWRGTGGTMTFEFDGQGKRK